MSKDYFTTLCEPERRRYIDKLNIIGLSQCPFSLPSFSWKNDPTEWPNVNYGDIYNYLIESPGIYSHTLMKNFRSLDAHNFFISGWVQTVYHHKPANSYCTVFKADVKPSWRVTDPSHHSWVAVRSDGTVVAAHCDCMAGLGETCSHVGAVLFKIEASVRLGYNKVACTDLACQWNKVCTKKVEPGLIKDIEFYSDSAKAKPPSKRCKYKGPVPPATEAQQMKLLEMLSSTGTNAVALQTHKTFKKTAKPWFLNLDSISEEDVDSIDRETINQASSALWHRHRVGRVTGSIAHRVLHTSPTTPAPSLISTICQPKNRAIKTPCILWGKNHESDALETYKTAVGIGQPKQGTSTQIYMHDQVGTSHVNLQVKRAGFRVSLDKPFIGTSSDGYVMCDCCGPGVVEAKCPYNWGQDMGGSLDQWLHDPRGHLQSATGLKNNHPYFTQAQMEMFVTKSSYCDFITWTPQLCVIFRIPRNEDFICDAVGTITDFWTCHILPRLTLNTQGLEHNPGSCSSSGIAGTEAGRSCANDKSAVKGKRKGIRTGSGGSEGIMTGTSRAEEEQSDDTSQ